MQRGICTLLRSAGAAGLAVILAACGGGEAGGSGGAGGVSPPPPLPQRGQAVALAQCSSCHGAMLTGTPVGGWAPNLTPDPATGLGTWSEEEITRAVRQGLRKDGNPLCATMPRFDAGALSAADLGAVIAYLRWLPATVSPPKGGCGI